jgi:hypothetical protein
MSKPEELSASAKKLITSDWAKSFPSLGVYKPMWLLKRHGPLLMGILLERTRSNDVYLPCFHVHNLLVPSSTIALSLVYPVPNPRQPRLPREIKVLRHKDDYLAAVDFLTEAVPDLAKPTLSWHRLVQLHGDFIRQRRDYAVAKFCAGLFRDVILLAHWCGHENYARHCQMEALRLMKSWKPPVDIASWQAVLNVQFDRNSLQRTLDAEITKHKLEKVPVCELSGAGDAESITSAYTAAWLT